MTTAQTKRSIRTIQNQYIRYTDDPIDNIELKYNDENLFKMEFNMIGPVDTPWDGCNINGYI